jgi:hypothetical protein
VIKKNFSFVLFLFEGQIKESSSVASILGDSEILHVFSCLWNLGGNKNKNQK